MPATPRTTPGGLLCGMWMAVRLLLVSQINYINQHHHQHHNHNHHHRHHHHILPFFFFLFSSGKERDEKRLLIN